MDWTCWQPRLRLPQMPPSYHRPRTALRTLGCLTQLPRFPLRSPGGSSTSSLSRCLRSQSTTTSPRLQGAKLPVTDISQWLERYSLMAALLATRFPDKAPELFSYQATIVRAELNYEGKRWVTYDRQFLREALARKDLNWSVTNPRLYNEAFTGRARAIPRCSFCLQDDHRAADCPRDPNRPVFGGMVPWPVHSVAPQQQASDRAPHAEICRRYNDGKCKQRHCRYRHACSGCCGPNMLLECPQRQRSGRDRSPRRSAFRGGAQP